MVSKPLRGCTQGNYQLKLKQDHKSSLGKLHSWSFLNLDCHVLNYYIHRQQFTGDVNIKDFQRSLFYAFVISDKFQYTLPQNFFVFISHPMWFVTKSFQPSAPPPFPLSNLRTHCGPGFKRFSYPWSKHWYKDVCDKIASTLIPTPGRAHHINPIL